MSIVFTYFKNPKLPISIKIPVILLQLVYICMTVISPNSSSWATSLLHITCYVRGCKMPIYTVHNIFSIFYVLHGILLIGAVLYNFYVNVENRILGLFDCKARKSSKYCISKRGRNAIPPHISGATIEQWIHSNRTTKLTAASAAWQKKCIIIADTCTYPAWTQCWATIGPPAKRHSNGVSLEGRWWPAL